MREKKIIFAEREYKQEKKNAKKIEKKEGIEMTEMMIKFKSDEERMRKEIEEKENKIKKELKRIKEKKWEKKRKDFRNKIEILEEN